MLKRIPVVFFVLCITLFILAIGQAFCEDAVVPPAEQTPAAVAPAVPTATPAPAEQVTPAPSPTAPQLQNITITPDTDIFRRTPVIDGTIDDGEWDAFYSFSDTGWDVTTYADWDSSNLYFAVKSNKPVSFVSTLDANNDGWLNGEDNYRFDVSPGSADMMSLIVSRYDSRHTVTAAAVPVTPPEAAMVTVKNSNKNGFTMVEMQIPAELIRGFRLSANHRIGLQLAVKSNESKWIPSDLPGDTCECSLVMKKIAALKPLDLGFDLRDYKIARGEDLVARFHLTNTGNETIDARSFVIAGEGKSGDYLSSEKIRLEGLPPKKHMSHDVESIIPSDMPLGSWALGAEVKSSDGRLGGVLVSFDVVDPFEVEISVPRKPVRPDVKDVTLGVIINNNMRRNLRGTAKIILPAGWELWKNADKRDFSISGESISSVSFKAKPPLGVSGTVPVKVEVTANGKTVTSEGAFIIANQ